MSVCGGGVTQALGSVGGVLAVMEVMPPKYRHLIGGPSLKVSLHTGAIAEGVLTFVITFVVLLIMIRGPRSEAVKTVFLAFDFSGFFLFCSGLVRGEKRLLAHKILLGN